MAHPDLSAIQDAFFTQFLVELPGRPTLDTLRAAQPAGQPLILHGDYIAYTGRALTPLPGVQITSRFAVRAAEPGATGGLTYVLLWLVERIDVATDSAATMTRILADFRPPAPPTPAAAPPRTLDRETAGRWATALSAPATRQTLALDLDRITQVPAGLPTADLEELKTFLRHFATYRANGTYYAKGSVAEGHFPDGAATPYLQESVQELELQRDSFYCAALVGERLWNPRASADRFRQLVYRIDDLGADAPARYRLALLMTVTAQAAANRFIFFRADEGLGVPISAAAAVSVSPQTAELLSDLPSDPAGIAAAIGDPSIPIVGTAESPLVLLIGRVEGVGPLGDLPPGVTESGEGVIRNFRCPPNQVLALSQRTDIHDLDLAPPIYLSMADAANQIRLGARTFPAGVTAANTGQGVLIGIVDSGIDGGHPAFLGNAADPTRTRIHSVWKMAESGGQSPRARSGNAAAYAGMTFGREYIGHTEVSTVRDWGADGAGNPTPSHGTHVAGIAAGRGHASLGAWPGGIAPAATLVVVSVGTSGGGYVSDVILGVRYCFEKARQLGLPCVVNISLGTMRHSFDGSDPLSIALTQLVSENVAPVNDYLASVMPQFLPGRIICAAAGNNRGEDLHWQATLDAGATISALYQPFSRGGQHRGGRDGVTFWAYSEDGSTVRLELQARHATNAVLATGTVGPQRTHAPVLSNLPGNLRVSVHNGPGRPNNRHYNPEIYWSLPATPAASPALPTSPWVLTFRNLGSAPAVIHGFAAFREHHGGFIFAPAQTQPLLGITYSMDQLAQLNRFKVSTPGVAPGTICVAAFVSRAPGAGWPAQNVGDLAFFSSPGPLRAVIGRRAIDVTAPGHQITSAKSWMPSDASRGTVAMSGTSMATPIVTGLIAGLLQQNPALRTSDILRSLEAACTRRPTDSVEDWGLGRIDASLFRP